MTAWEDYKAKAHSTDIYERDRTAKAYVFHMAIRSTVLPDSVLLAIEQKIFEDEDD